MAFACLAGASSCSSATSASQAQPHRVYVSRPVPNSHVLLVPELQGGTAGWCLATGYRTMTESSGGCGELTTTSTGPIFAEEGCDESETGIHLYALTTRLRPPMTDEELDELILSRLCSRREQAELSELGDATQSTTDMAAAFNEPDVRVDARVLVLAGEGRIRSPLPHPAAGCLPDQRAATGYSTSCHAHTAMRSHAARSALSESIAAAVGSGHAHAARLSTKLSTTSSTPTRRATAGAPLKSRSAREPWPRRRNRLKSAR